MGMATHLTRERFAELCGVTRQAISLAVKQERIHLTRRRIDPDHPTNRHYKQQSRNRRRQPAPISGAPASPIGTELPPGDPAVAKTLNTPPRLSSSQTEMKNLDPEADATVYRNQIDVAKALEQMKGLQIKNEKERNELISRNLVKQFFSELYSVETTEFMTMAERMGPEIASLFGIDDPADVIEVGKHIQGEITKSLGHVEQVMEKFLKGFQVEQY